MTGSFGDPAPPAHRRPPLVGPTIACFGTIKILTRRKRNNDLHAWTGLAGVRPSWGVRPSAGTAHWSLYGRHFYRATLYATGNFVSLSVCHTRPAAFRPLNSSSCKYFIDFVSLDVRPALTKVCWFLRLRQQRAEEATCLPVVGPSVRPAINTYFTWCDVLSYFQRFSCDNKD